MMNLAEGEWRLFIFFVIEVHVLNHERPFGISKSLFSKRVASVLSLSKKENWYSRNKKSQVRNNYATSTQNVRKTGVGFIFTLWVFFGVFWF